MKIEQYLLGIIKNQYRIIVAGFLFAAIICIVVTDFSIENSIDSWIDKSSVDYQHYRQMVSEFGDDATLLVVFDRADLASSRLHDYQSFIEQIRTNRGVSIVFDPVDMFLLGPEGTSLDETVIEDLKKSFFNNPADFRNVLMSPDIETLAILIILQQDLEQLHPQIINEVEQGMDQLGLPCHLAGTSYFSDTLSKALTRDLSIVITVLVIVTLLVMQWFLRSPVVVACVITGIAISLLYTLALTSLLHIKFNLLTLILYPLIFCISITTSIHFFSRREAGNWNAEYAYKKIFRPTIITMITTVIGCSAFAFAPQTIVREMGLVFPAAIVISYLVVLIFVPSACQWLANSSSLQPLPVTRSLKPASMKNKLVSLLLASMTIIAVWQLPRLRTEPDAIYFFSPSSELIQSYKYIENKLTGLMVVDMVIKTKDGSSISTKDKTQQIKLFLNSAGKLPGLTTVVSPLDWLNSYMEDAVMPDFKQAYINENRLSMRLSFRFRNISDVSYSDNINKLKQLWEKSDHPELIMHITGLLPLILDAQDALLKTQRVVFPVILIMMTLVLFFIIPSLKVLVAATVANILPLIIMAGAMALFDIPVNSFNLFVLSVMLGVIVDDTIHLLYAWNATGSIERAMHEVKPALWFTTVTIVLAFASLLFSSLRPVLQFGLLSVIAVIIAYLCDVFLLPLLLGKKQVKT